MTHGGDACSEHTTSWPTDGMAASTGHRTAGLLGSDPDSHPVEWKETQGASISCPYLPAAINTAMRASGLSPLGAVCAVKNRGLRTSLSCQVPGWGAPRVFNAPSPVTKGKRPSCTCPDPGELCGVSTSGGQVTWMVSHLGPTNGSLVQEGLSSVSRPARNVHRSPLSTPTQGPSCLCALASGPLGASISHPGRSSSPAPRPGKAGP